ncbi:DUF6156 family protein [Microbulbifer sp. ANSA002]|uniref:DUF6156 family protein n=1 Tax=unclassified Microbulbifer TaxID=2619833 RepID=UPI0040417067
MIFLRRFIFGCTLIASCLFAIGCQAEMSDSENKMSDKVYFSSFSGYSIPLNLIGEITKDEAASLDSYYVAYFDDKGVLLSVEKYFRGSLFFKHDYFYHKNGSLKESRVVNADGKETVSFFDGEGKAIKKD